MPMDRCFFLFFFCLFVFFCLIIDDNTFIFLFLSHHFLILSFSPTTIAAHLKLFGFLYLFFQCMISLISLLICFLLFIFFLDSYLKDYSNNSVLEVGSIEFICFDLRVCKTLSLLGIPAKNTNTAQYKLQIMTHEKILYWKMSPTMSNIFAFIPTFEFKDWKK